MADTSSSRYDAGKNAAEAPGMSCTVTTREIEGVTIFDIAGRMSFPDPHVQNVLAAQLAKGQKAFVLNFSRVTYIDSYGLQDLVSAYSAVKTAGGKLVLLGPIPNVKKTIEITMKGIFLFFEVEGAAVQAVLK
jgi:anti-sigma B factor antagonist